MNWRRVGSERMRYRIRSGRDSDDAESEPSEARAVYVDIETGGLEIHRPIIQIGAIAVDEELNEVEQFEQGEHHVALPAMNSFRHTHEFFKGRIPQVPEFGQNAKEEVLTRMAWLDEELADREFIAGDTYTIADITAQVGIDFGRVTKIGIAEDQTHLQRWHDAVSSRPSASA